MNFIIIIPAHNEEAYLAQTLNSLVVQTLLPKKIVIVNDGSTDGTQKIIDKFSKTHHFITSIYHDSAKTHAPGSKVINAFYKGLQSVKTNFDIICKFDADLIFPSDYLEKIAEIFKRDSEVGMAGGFCYIDKTGEWVLENLTNKDHIRGALKAYRKECFEDIGGLKSAMGWDTVDELLAQYHGWKIQAQASLKVKHLKPTGKVYIQVAKLKQGKAFYRMRYGFWLTFIASGKLAFRKKSLRFFMDCLNGYHKAKKENLEFLVSEEEGRFVRKLRWEGIKSKLLLQ